LNIATETYIKEALGSLLGKVWVNGKGFIKTGEFKKRLDRESELNAGGLGVGSLVNNAEAEERRRRKMLNMEDLKLALRLGDGYLGQSPIIAASILNSRCLDTQGIEDLYNYEDKGVHANGNGVVGGEVWNVDFTNGDVGDPMQIDGEEGNGWQGGDAHGLDDVLDDVLNLADL
jgi:transcriptional coactivator HFI1/ADA1